MNCLFRKLSHPCVLSALSLALLLGCTDDVGDEGGDLIGDGDGDTTGGTDEGTGDGDPGDGDGDPGDGDGDAGDGDPGDGDGDGDGDSSCDGVTPVVTEISPDELATMLETKDFEFINVHVPYAGEIPGTDVHVAFTDIPAIEAQLGDDVATKAVLYCLTGPMSAIAASDLVDLGYCRIYDMPAGMIGWEAEGYPVDP